MGRSKYFAAVFTFTALTILGLQNPLCAAEQVQPEMHEEYAAQTTDTYDIYSAEQLSDVLTGRCLDAAYRTMYDKGTIRITMKNVSALNGGEVYSLSSNIAIADGKEFILDMNGLDLYASGQDGQSTVNPFINVPSTSSLTIQSSWVDSSIRSISICNQGYLKLDRTHLMPSMGQAVYNTGTSELFACSLYAGENEPYAVYNDGGTVLLNGEEDGTLSQIQGIYNKGNESRQAELYLGSGFCVTGGEAAVINDGGFFRMGELAEKNTSLIQGVKAGILTVNGGSTEMYDGTVQGGSAAVSTTPHAVSANGAVAPGGNFVMIGGTLSGDYGVAFEADSYVYLKAGQVSGTQAAVTSFARDGMPAANITFYQFYNTDSQESDAYYYDESAKTNILCKEICNGKIVLPESQQEELTEEAVTDNEEEPAETLIINEEESAEDLMIDQEEPAAKDAEETEQGDSGQQPDRPDGMLPETPQYVMPVDAKEEDTLLETADEGIPSASDVANAYNVRDGTTQSICFSVRDGTAQNIYFSARDGTG